MYEFLGIYIKKMYNGVLQCSHTGLIHKVLEATEMDHFNGLPTPNKVDTPSGTDYNGPEDKIFWIKPYDSVIGIMLYLT